MPGQILFSLLLIFSLLGYAQPGNGGNHGFIPNHGQFGKNGEAQHEVLFGSSNQSVFLRQNGVSYITEVRTKALAITANEE